MALTKEQQSLKDAILRSNTEYRNNGGKVSEATKQATASAERAAMSAGASADRDRGSSSSSSSNRGSSGAPAPVAPAAPPKSVASAPAPVVKPAASVAVTRTGTSKDHQAWIQQTTPGGLAAYVASQQKRYEEADDDLKSKLEKDAKEVGYELKSPANTDLSRFNGKEMQFSGSNGSYSKKFEDMNSGEKSIFLGENGYGADTRLANKDGQSFNGTGYAYLDEYGMEHVSDDLGTALAYGKAGSVQTYEGSFGGGYGTSSDGERGTLGIKGATPYGNVGDKPGQQKGITAAAGKLNTLADGIKSATANKYLSPTLASVIGGRPKTAVADEKKIEPEQTPAAAPVMDLAYGAKGENVKALQKSLGVSADGIFGPKTADALKAYQAKNNLPVTGKLDGSTQAALSKVNEKATANTDNQVKYLQGLVSKGGGDGEWAKGQLKKMGVDPAAAPASADAPATPEVKSPQTGGTDFFASALSALESGDAEGAMAFAQKRAAKIAGLKAQGQDVSAYEAQQAKLEESINGAMPANSTTSIEDKMNDVIAKSEGDLQKLYDDIQKVVADSGDIELKDAMSYEMAKANAGAQLDPKYDDARTSLMDTLARDAASRGFYGQKPTDVEMMKQVGNLENDRAADVATLANTLVGQSKEESYRDATFKQGQVQQKLSNMLSVLQARGTLSQNTINNLQALLNNENQKKAQATADKQLEASTFGTVDGKPTLAYQNMLKQWGYSDAEADRAAQLFPYQLKEAKLAVQAAQQSLAGGSGGGGPKSTPVPTVDVDKVLNGAADYALKFVGTMKTEDGDNNKLYNQAYDDYLKRNLPNQLYQVYTKNGVVKFNLTPQKIAEDVDTLMNQ